MPPPPLRLAWMTASQTSSLVQGEIAAERYNRVRMTQIGRTAQLAREQMTRLLASSVQTQLIGTDFLTSAIGESAENLKSTLEVGFAGLNQTMYDLHADNIATHHILSDLLEAIVDRESYLRRKATELENERKRQDYLHAQSEFTDALKLTKTAFNEFDDAKKDAMLREAMLLLQRASNNPELALDAKLHLAGLYDSYLKDRDRAKELYSESVGETYSAHSTRVRKLLADLEYRENNFSSAIGWLEPLLYHFQALEHFADEIRDIQSTPWTQKEQKIADVLNRNSTLLKHSSIASKLKTILDAGRFYSVGNAIDEQGGFLIKELLAARPELDVIFQIARNVARLGQGAESTKYLEMVYARLSGLTEKKAFLIEIAATGDFSK